MNPSDVSVVIATLNEACTVAGAVKSALAAGAIEVIVADGGSRDDTSGRAGEAGATKILQSAAGRGRQSRRGAAAAGGSYVLFLHADNRLAAPCLQQICDCGDPVWGAFRQRIDAAGCGYRLLEAGNALRVRWRRMPFGDQAIFVRRDVLDQQGGIPGIPLLEDVELSRRLRRIAPPLLLDGPVIVDPRRWQRRGLLRQTLRNWAIQAAHALGVSPQRLKQWYR